MEPLALKRGSYHGLLGQIFSVRAGKLDLDDRVFAHRHRAGGGIRFGHRKLALRLKSPAVVDLFILHIRKADDRIVAEALLRCHRKLIAARLLHGIVDRGFEHKMTLDKLLRSVLGLYDKRGIPVDKARRARRCGDGHYREKAVVRDIVRGLIVRIVGSSRLLRRDIVGIMRPHEMQGKRDCGNDYRHGSRGGNNASAHSDPVCAEILFGFVFRDKALVYFSDRVGKSVRVYLFHLIFPVFVFHVLHTL